MTYGCVCDHCGWPFKTTIWGTFLCDYCISGQADEIMWEAA
jgi:hypothetical protein